ncbi:MAG: hypothetical protein AB3N23_10095 [Paracoccaceae bacterium]
MLKQWMAAGLILGMVGAAQAETTHALSDMITHLGRLRSGAEGCGDIETMKLIDASFDQMKRSPFFRAEDVIFAEVADTQYNAWKELATEGLCDEEAKIIALERLTCILEASLYDRSIRCWGDD